MTERKKGENQYKLNFYIKKYIISSTERWAVYPNEKLNYEGSLTPRRRNDDDLCLLCRLPRTMLEETTRTPLAEDIASYSPQKI